MKFRESFPDYEQLNERDLYFKSVPAGMLGPLQGYILRYANTSDKLKRLCQHMATLVPCEGTSNWGWDFLVPDFEDLLRRLAQGKFHKFMDLISHVADTHVQSDSELEDLNDVFEQFEFGYRIEYISPYQKSQWRIVGDAELQNNAIDEAIATTIDVCEQARLHLVQAKDHLAKDGNDRALKDALRDCLSAMETIVKHVSSKPDFDAGCQFLQSSPAYGSKEISREPSRLWHWIHQLYPDVRHGQPFISSLSFEEASFWIDRILAISIYVIRIHKK